MDRLDRDRQVAREKLPTGTVEMDFDGVPCFLYQVTCEMGNRYVMCLYFEGRHYQVKVVEPNLEGHFGVHGSHLYSDGKLCLSEVTNAGVDSMEQAFARSVLWANGFSVMLASGEKHEFPWNKPS